MLKSANRVFHAIVVRPQRRRVDLDQVRPLFPGLFSEPVAAAAGVARAPNLRSQNLSDYIARHVTGLDAIRSWFEDFDARAAIEVCQLDYEQVREVCRLTASRRSSMHTDLGVLMNRHITVTSFLEILLMAIQWFITAPPPS